MPRRGICCHFVCAVQLVTSCRSFQNMPPFDAKHILTSAKKKQRSHTFTDHRTSGGINRSCVPTPKHPRNHFGRPNKNPKKENAPSLAGTSKNQTPSSLERHALSQAMGQRWGTPKNMVLEVLVSFLVSKTCDCWY